MELIRSNQTEALADALADQVRRHPLRPWERDVIVVQSRGMERWLSLALAERLGIWANPSFPFPRKQIERVLDALGIGSSEAAQAYEPRRLKWTVAELLRRSPPADLGDYLRRPIDEDRVLRLATRVATVFDEYSMYRPNLLRRWVNGEEPGYWQAELWREVTREAGEHHLAARIEEGIHQLRAIRSETDLGLQRLHLFSLETLPPLFLRFFGELSQVVPTTLYLLEPSEAYLGNVPTRGERASSDPSERDGHGFLTDVGRLSRDFQELVLSVDEQVLERKDDFRRPSPVRLLNKVQRDVLEFRSPPSPDEREHLEVGDLSLSVHACAGPMREAQVLHDLIRSALEADDELRPEDIVVMAPDLETYAPVFRAVFGEQEQRAIPYEIHDRGTRDDVSLSDEFLSTLEVLDSRFSVLDLMRLVDTRHMREELRFSESERARLADLITSAGARWGIDADHRGALGFPEEPAHTWRTAFERLFLGFAFMPGSTAVFEGRLPRGSLSLADAELVARFARLCETLFIAEERMREPLTLDAWAEQLGWLCTGLFAEDGDGGAGVRMLRGAIDGLRSLATKSGYSGSVSLKSVRRELRAWLQHETPPLGFLRRGVTLTQLVPLRSVPFKVVCLVGLSADAFPRPDDRPSFDRSREEHLPGDRNKRDDDRHSFLQALLCAREQLVITYTVATASEKPEQDASALVLELRDALSEYYEKPGGVLEPIVHPLHAFDRAYFDGGALPRSFSSRHAEVARIMERPPVERPRVELVAPPGLERIAEQLSTTSVDELSRWLWNPSEAFIEDVLEARFGSATIDEPTSALTELSPLDHSRVGSEALREGLHGAALGAFLSASPELPDGSWGSLLRGSLRREIESVAAAEREARGEEDLGARLFETEVGGVSLDARLDGVGTKRRVIKRFTKEGSRAELTAWLEHLLMHTSPEPQPTETLLALRGEDAEAKLVAFGPVRDAREHLEKLVSIYRASWERPRPLFGRASRELVVALEKGDEAAFKSAKAKLDKAVEWSESLAFALDGVNPFTNAAWRHAFRESALSVYGPLLEHRSAR